MRVQHGVREERRWHWDVRGRGRVRVGGAQLRGGCSEREEGGCAGRVAECNNSEGSYTCVCNTGYERSDADAGCGGWQTGASCVNTEGSFECVCNAGYTGPGGGECMACEPGKYKAVNGSSDCLACEAGTYLDVSGGTACLACPANAYSTSASDAITRCICNAGHEGSDGGPCMPSNGQKSQVYTQNDLETMRKELNDMIKLNEAKVADLKSMIKKERMSVDIMWLVIYGSWISFVAQQASFAVASHFSTYLISLGLIDVLEPTAGALVFFMQCGFAMLEAGVHPKNVTNIPFKVRFPLPLPPPQRVFSNLHPSWTPARET